MKTHFYTKDILSICENNHVTVDEIFAKISQLYENVGKSSIYRNVEELVGTGELRKVIGIGKKSYFETNTGNHIHLIDTDTGKIIDFKIESLDIPGLPANFHVEDIDVKLFGKMSA